MSVLDTVRSQVSPAAYRSPQHSPELDYGSQSASRPSSGGSERGNNCSEAEGWEQRWQDMPSRHRGIPSLPPSRLEPSMQFHYQRHRPLPSPPQQHRPAFVPHLVPGYRFSSARIVPSHGVSPLTPPASDGDGLTSSDESREAQPKRGYDNISSMWVPTGYSDGKSGAAEMGPHSPPIQFIEDILQQDDDEQMHEQQLQQHRLFAAGYHGHSLGFVPGNGGGNDNERRNGDGNPLKRRHDEFVLPSPDSSSVEPSSPPPSAQHRKKRQLTGASEAAWTCEKCGKYFSRIWNYNAHLETHNPDRPRPHACPYHDCGKTFVRKTDLTRHTQCVHAKDKRFHCELCGNTFARKDTLRRHEDDGCPQRVDILSRHSRNQPLSVQSQALSCFFSRRDSEQQMFHGGQQQFDCHPQQSRHHMSYDTPASYNPCLPPLPGMGSIQKAASWDA